MDTDLILSTSNLKPTCYYKIGKKRQVVKISNIILIVGLLFSCISCSSIKKIYDKSDNYVDRKANQQEQDETTVEITTTNTGPTKKGTAFIDATEKFGLAGVKAVHLYAVDFNNDTHTDLVVLPGFYSSPEFYQFNYKAKKFVRVSSLFEEEVRASFLNFADINNDGILDVLVATLNQKTELTKRPLRFYFGKNKKDGTLYFKKKEKIISTSKDPISTALLFDMNLDGVLDLFVGNWFYTKKDRPVAKTNILYLMEKGKYKDQSVLLENENQFKRSYDKYINARPTFTAAICDIDQNGYPDILTGNSSGYKNKLWLNIKNPQGNRYYKDFGESSRFASDSEGSSSKLGGGNTFALHCADYNNDTIMDIFVGELSHSYDQETRDRSSILSGEKLDFPPSFIRTEYHLSSGEKNWSQGDRRGVWADLNADGLLDLIVDNSGFPPNSRLVIFMQDQTHAYENKSIEFGIDILNPSGTVVLDIDKDGLLDIITGQTQVRNSKIDSSLYVFQNYLKVKGNRSVTFYLEGEKANRMGIGANIILKTQELTQRRYVTFAEGSLPSQNSRGVHFGLGKHILKTVKVVWPIAVKTSGRAEPLVRTYDLTSFKFRKHIDVTLCDSGKLRFGIKTCLN